MEKQWWDEMMKTVCDKEGEIELIKKGIIKSNRKLKNSTRDERENLRDWNRYIRNSYLS